MNDLYRLVYTSRNLIPGGEDEQSAAVGGILAVSKRNNARAGGCGHIVVREPASYYPLILANRTADDKAYQSKRIL